MIAFTTFFDYYFFKTNISTIIFAVGVVQSAQK